MWIRDTFWSIKYVLVPGRPIEELPTGDNNESGGRAVGEGKLKYREKKRALVEKKESYEYQEKERTDKMRG